MIFHQAAFILALATLGNAYSKFGRTCKDIGCLDNEVCVMETKPCSFYDQQNECGQYPTCKKTTDSAIPSCTGYVCPPTKVCQMDGPTPKCVDDAGTSGVVPLSGQSNYPGAPSAPSGGLYPNVPPLRGQTTTRPPNYRPSGYGGPGYTGGAIGSGYPGQQQHANYPGQGGGYPGQGSGYPGQGTGYPGQGSGYPGQGSGYPGQGSGYPGQGAGYPGYPTGQGQYGRSGYPGQYPQGGYQGQQYPQGRYPTNQYGQPYRSGSDSVVDKLTNQLKTIGTNLLKNALG